MMSKSKAVFNKAKQRWKKAKEETDYKEEQRRQSKKEKKKNYQFWFNGKPSFAEKMTYLNHQLTFVYAGNNLTEYGKPLYTIDCKYENEKVKGILIAFKDYLVFVSATYNLTRYFEYTQIKHFDTLSPNKNRIELSFKYNENKHFFKGFIKGEQTDKMISTLKGKIDLKPDNKPKQQNNATTESNLKINIENYDNKLDQLEKLGELRDNGTLTDEEFQKEKQKLLG